MPSLLDQYLPLAVFMAVAAVISVALLVAPFLVAFKAPDAHAIRRALLSGVVAFHHFRSRGRVFVSLGRGLPRGRGFRLLVDDDLSRRSDRRLHPP